MREDSGQNKLYDFSVHNYILLFFITLFYPIISTKKNPINNKNVKEMKIISSLGLNLKEFRPLTLINCIKISLTSAAVC